MNTYQFINKMKTINPKIAIIGKYINNHTKIKCQCCKCGYIWDVSPQLISVRGHGCPACANQVLVRGFNDMWTTNPELAKLLANPEDGYKYMQHSSKKVNWKCPNCGNILYKKPINDVSYQGLSCNYCSDGISYPEKFIMNLLKQLNVNFKYQKKFNWSYDKKYDFYVSDIGCIIEVNGEQHYHNSFIFKNSDHKNMGLIYQKENDEFKKQLAIKNGIDENHYIVIDCRESGLEWIRNSILNTNLKNFYDLSNVDWNKCHKNSLNSFIRQSCDLWNYGIKSTTMIASILGLSQSTICEYLKQGDKIDLCNYISERKRGPSSDYKRMIGGDLLNYTYITDKKLKEIFSKKGYKLNNFVNNIWIFEKIPFFEFNVVNKSKYIICN
jgi:hypothetical protein